MRRGTTPTLPLRIPNVSTLATDHVYITIEQQDLKITIESTSDQYAYNSETGVISLTLTQQDTLRLSPGTAQIQARGIGPTGSAWVTSIKSINIKKILLDGEISYE